MAYNRLLPSFSGWEIQPLKNVFHISPIPPLSYPSFCEKTYDWYEHCRPLTTLFYQKDMLEKKSPFRHPIFFREKRSNSKITFLAIHIFRGGKVEYDRTSPPSSLDDE